MASRRFYTAIAGNFKAALDREHDLDAIASVARDVATTCKIDNPNFRYDWFFDACGLDSHGYVKGTVHTR
jgi:hypothetical protein